MEKSAIKNTELHTLEKAQEILIDLAQVKSSMGLLQNSGQVHDQTIEGESKDKTNGNEGASKVADDASKIFGDSQKSEVIHEQDKGKIYSKLLFDGHDSDKKETAQKIATRLDQISQNQKPVESFKLNSIMNLVAPTIKTEYSEKMLIKYKIKDEEESSGQHSQEEDHDEEESNEKEETKTLQETDPGYYTSLVIKI